MINILLIIIIFIMYDYFNSLKKINKKLLENTLNKNNIILKYKTNHGNKTNNIKPPRRSYINIRTRGEPANYTQVGLLHHNNEVMHLYGRQKYRGSSQWEYFAVGKDGNTIQSKYPIKIKGDKEIEDGSSINLDYLNKTYKVKLYEYEDIRYLENI